MSHTVFQYKIWCPNGICRSTLKHNSAHKFVGQIFFQIQIISIPRVYKTSTSRQNFKFYRKTKNIVFREGFVHTHCDPNAIWKCSNVTNLRGRKNICSSARHTELCNIFFADYLYLEFLNLQIILVGNVDLKGKAIWSLYHCEFCYSELIPLPPENFDWAHGLGVSLYKKIYTYVVA